MCKTTLRRGRPLSSTANATDPPCSIRVSAGERTRVVYAPLPSKARRMAVRHSPAENAAVRITTIGAAASSAPIQTLARGTTRSSGKGRTCSSVSSPSASTRLTVTPASSIASSVRMPYWTTVRTRWPSWGNQRSISAAVLGRLHQRIGATTRANSTPKAATASAAKPHARAIQESSSRKSAAISTNNPAPATSAVWPSPSKICDRRSAARTCSN